MKKKVRPILIFVTLLLSSCTIPVSIYTLNNTEDEVTIILDHSEVLIKPGQVKSYKTLIFFDFEIQRGGKHFTYSVAEPWEKDITWSGWGPFTKRSFYTQLEPDGKIWAVSSKRKYPVKEFRKQPEGFPLVPST